MAIHEAVKEKKLEEVQAAVAAGEKDAQDAVGNTAMFYAANLGYLAILSYLLGENANPNLQNSLGWTALIGAIINSQVEAAKILLDDPRVDVTLHEQGTNRNALHFAAMYHLPVLVPLIAKKGLAHDKNFLDYPNAVGQSAFDLASDDLETTEALISARPK